MIQGAVWVITDSGMQTVQGGQYGDQIIEQNFVTTQTHDYTCPYFAEQGPTLGIVLDTLAYVPLHATPALAYCHGTTCC